MPARPTNTGARVEGQLVYAIGDVHGCYDLLKDLLGQFAKDASERALGRRPVLIFCGDYIDRGPDSAKVMETLVWLQRNEGLELHLLKGNHEAALLDFIEIPPIGKEWMQFGGAQTLQSYGIAAPGADGDARDFERARDDLLERMPASHLLLLQQLELMISIGDYAFVHAGARSGIPLAEQDEDDLLWIRKGFVDVPAKFEKIIVHGHSWRDDRPQLFEHRIGIDSGAYRTGVLTAIRLEDGEIEIFQARR